MELSFDWDPNKARDNIRKHGIAFGEAVTVFRDPFSLFILDLAHSTDEERLLILGFSERQRLLVVVHTDREDTICLISARLATANERRNYENQL